MVDIRDHGGLFGGGYRRGSRINVNNLENATLNKLRLFSIVSRSQNATNIETKKILVPISGGFTLVNDGAISIPFLKNPQGFSWGIPLSNGKFVCRLDNSLCITASTSDLTVDTVKGYLYVYNEIGTDPALIAYEYNGYLIIITGKLKYVKIDINNWKSVAGGYLPGSSQDTYQSDLRPTGWDYDRLGGTLYCKSGGTTGDLVTINMTDNPVLTRRVAAFSGMHGTVSNDGTEFFVYETSSNMVRVYNTSTWTVKRQFRLEMLPGEFINDYSYIEFIRRLDNQDMLLVGHSWGVTLCNINTGALVSVIERVIGSDAIEFSYVYPTDRVSRSDKSDKFYTPAVVYNTGYFDVIATTTKILS